MADSDDGLPAEEAEMSEADIGSDEEDERGSSAEEGSDEENDEEEGSDEEGSGDESPSERRRPRKKHKPFVAPPPRALPQRTTRGARVAAEAGEEGDEEFWNQEFFAEEANDDRYETESEPEDRFDADFSESEQEGDEDEEAAEAEADAKEKKKKTLRPPGYKKPPLPKAKFKAAAAAAGDSQDGSGGEQGGGSGAKKRGGGKQRRSSVGSGDFTVGRRTVRDSTRLKVEEGELERKMAVKYKPRRAPQRSSNYKPLTQAELLAEAAKTEIENTKSLQMLVAMEEETKKRAQVHKKRYAGPMVRWKSRKVGEEEMSTLEVRNMAVPDELRRQVAPLPPPRQLCAITGQPARFFDPLTRLPYASLEAYRELRRRREAGQLGGAPPGGVPQQGQQQQQQQQQHSQGHVPVALPGMPAMPLQEQQGMPQQFLQPPTAMFQQPQLQQQFPDLPMPLPDMGQQLQPLPFLPPTAAGGGGAFF